MSKGFGSGGPREGIQCSIHLIHSPVPCLVRELPATSDHYVTCSHSFEGLDLIGLLTASDEGGFAMGKWSVEVEISTPQNLDEEFADRMLDYLADYAPAVSFDGPHRASIRLDVDANGPVKAGKDAAQLVTSKARDLVVDRLQIERVEDLQRTLDVPTHTGFLGVAELADALGVSRQRVSELARSHDFPKPVAELKSGPIWRRSSVARFIGTWPRRRGRPPKNEALVTGRK